jgi:hypothetical protein
MMRSPSTDQASNQNFPNEKTLSMDGSGVSADRPFERAMHKIADCSVGAVLACRRCALATILATEANGE